MIFFRTRGEPEGIAGKLKEAGEKPHESYARRAKPPQRINRLQACRAGGFARLPSFSATSSACTTASAGAFSATSLAVNDLFRPLLAAAVLQAASRSITHRRSQRGPTLNLYAP